MLSGEGLYVFLEGGNLFINIIIYNLSLQQNLQSPTTSFTQFQKYKQRVLCSFFISNIIVIMRGHQTYSLNTILNTQQIQPYIYQQILHDIKSPLEQVSIDITNDNSLEFQRPPKRPNIPPPPPKSPLNHLAEINFSRTHESYEMQLKDSGSKKKEIFHDEIIQSVLSPLDQQISFKEQQAKAPFLCGGLMQSIFKQQNSFEIQLPARTKISKRRPIFQTSKYQKTQKSQKSIDEVITILYDLGELQMAMFFQLLRDLTLHLANIMLQKQQIKNYLQVIYDRLSDNIQFVEEEKESAAETYRILRRLRSKNTYELITKIVKENSKERNSEANRQLQKLLESLNKLQKTIARFMQSKQAIQILDLVYDTIAQNYQNEKNLFMQIQKLCESFSCVLSLKGFQLIWREGDLRKLSKQEFVEGISMNDYIVRIPRNFEDQLKIKGFTRNQ